MERWKDGNEDGNMEHSTAGKVESLWMTREATCRYLRIGKSTLYKLIKQGEIRKRRDGRRVLYRPLRAPGNQPGILAESPRDSTAADGIVESTPVETTETSPATTSQDLRPLLELVERYADRVAELEREKAEAVALGHRALDQRDRLQLDLDQRDEQLDQAVAALARANEDVRRLHSLVEHLTDAVVEASRSPLALPVRGRLRAILAT